jgi:hypothetical protein
MGHFPSSVANIPFSQYWSRQQNGAAAEIKLRNPVVEKSAARLNQPDEQDKIFKLKILF